MTALSPNTQHVSLEPDWSREKPRKLWDPSRRLLQCIRRWQSLRDRDGVVVQIKRKFWSLQHLFWSVVTQCEIQLTTEIGGGLLLTHPNGIVIHPDVKIGVNCLIMHQVTIGRGNQDTDVPEVGNHVDISAGAKIVGRISIGDYSIVGLNTVLMKSVPDGGIAIGIPAKIRVDANRMPERHTFI